MEDYIDDGKPHILSDKWGYILNYIEVDNPDKTSQLSLIQENFVREYCIYLMENDPERVISILIEKFMPDQSGLTCEDLCFVMREPWVISCLDQKSSIALKFKRISDDNLR
jgi:hypothetical protein